MPIMDGFQTLQEIRGDQNLKNTPVVAVASSAMSGDREAILARGFDGYISKPIDPKLLEGMMLSLLGKGASPPTTTRTGVTYENTGHRR